jgi:hypothetical protein
MKIKAYKRVLIVLGILLFLICLGSCNATKRAEKKFQKAINKFGQKESANYIITKYPEYFKTKTIHDTTIVKIPVIIPGDTLNVGFNCDSLVQSLQDGTTVALGENKKLKLEVEKLGKRLKIKSTLKPDTIVVHDTIPVTVQVPCPDIDMLSTKDVELLTEQLKHKKAQVTNLYLIIALLIAGFIGFEYFKYNKKQDKTI